MHILKEHKGVTPLKSKCSYFHPSERCSSMVEHYPKATNTYPSSSYPNLPPDVQLRLLEHLDIHD